ncbi:MAG TPA: hypothetical protein VLX85_10750 [Stellaceae bacterium]|nr:hypothetical protein [Stellaceae bacterium]
MTSDEKSKKLELILAKLSHRQALAFARSLETERALGKASLPTEAILAALRPQLRQGQAPRVPTLCRLACTAFEEFLTDSTELKRPEGRITRAVIGPWWKGVQAVAGNDMLELERSFRDHVAGTEKAALGLFAETVHRAVRQWTETLLKRLTEGEGDPSLKAIFAGLNLMADLREVARILPLAEMLRSGLDAVIAAAQDDGKARGRWLSELGPKTSAEAARQYRKVRDAVGVDVGYFALALINRLERPWDVLALGRELAWRQDGSLVRDTEFGAIGRRLLREFEILAREIGGFAGNAQGPLAPLLATLERYAEASRALLGEGGFRRGSTWAEEVGEIRGQVVEALGAPFIERLGETMLAVLPPRGTGAGVIPEQPAIRRAAEAARLVVFLRENGGKSGIIPGVQRAAEQSAKEIGRRIKEITAAAKNAEGDAARASQAEAASLLSDILFAEDGGEIAGLQVKRPRKAPTGTAAE